MSGFLYRIEHETRYVHVGGVATSQHVAYLMPRTLPRQSVRWHELSIEPAPASRVHRVDYFGNAVEQFTILTPYDELRVVGRSVVEVIATEVPIGADAGAPWEAVRDELFYKRGAPYADASEFSYPSPYAATAPELAEFARASFAPDRPVVAAAVDLMHRIHAGVHLRSRIDDNRHAGDARVDRSPRRLPGLRAPADRLPAIAGARRALRERVSLDRTAAGQPRLVGADASHAWLSIWCPRLGWVDLDPTNDVLPSHRHVTLAWGRDYGDVSPLRGVVLGGGTHTLHVGVSVTPASVGVRSSSSFAAPDSEYQRAGVTVGRPRTPPPEWMG